MFSSEPYGFLPVLRSDDQTTDSYQDPGDFLNLGENQTKIEEQENGLNRSDWNVNQSQQNNNMLIENNHQQFYPQQIEMFQQQEQQIIKQQSQPQIVPLPMNHKRSMKIKKEQAKNRVRAKKEQEKQMQQQLQQQQIMKQENNDSDTTNEINPIDHKQDVSSNNSGSESTSASKTDKNMAQKIRNRISAQNSRDRKKKYISDLEEENKIQKVQLKELNDKINQLNHNHQLTKDENLQLRQQIRELKLKYDIPEQQDYFQDPNLTSIKSGSYNKYGTLGVALFSIISFVMVISSNYKGEAGQAIQLKSLQQGNGSNTDLSSNLQLSDDFVPKIEELDKESTEYNQLNEVIKCNDMQLKDDESIPEEVSMSYKDLRKQQKKALMNQIKQEEENNNNNDEKIQIEEESLIEETQLVDFHNHKGNFRPVCKNCDTEQGDQKGLAVRNGQDLANRMKVNTIFCPQPYKYKTKLNGEEQDLKINIQDSEWIQLYIPKSKLNFFSKDLDNIYVIRNEDENSSKNDTTIIEVWAKVQSVREINA